MKGLILAAGRGTRLKAVDPDLPKVLHQIGGRTCLERILLGMGAVGINAVGIVIGYQGDRIRETIGSGEHLGLEITYVEQDLKRYGTGAAVWTAQPFWQGDSILFSFGDILVHPENYQALVDKYGDGGEPILGVNWVEDPTAGSAVYLDSQDHVKEIIEKPTPGTSETHWNSAGTAVLTPNLLAKLEHLAPSARGEYELTHAYREYLATGGTLWSHRITGYWQDIGRPEDLARVRTMAEQGEL